MIAPDKQPNWTPATYADPKSDPDPRAKPLAFVLTPSERDAVAIVKCDIAAMQRRFREPEGLTVGVASQAEWDDAREAFRRTL